MDLLLLLKAALLGIIEGLTEFLPISSTGHLILGSALLDFTGERAKLFLIVIQSAAILAVVWEYRQRLSLACMQGTREGIAALALSGKFGKRLLQPGRSRSEVFQQWQRLFGAFMQQAASLRLLLNVAIAFIPLAALGLVFGKWLKLHLFNAPVVATTFIVGGLIILWAERKSHHERVATVESMNWLDGLKVGIAQAFALIPGTSRSGATIIGGMLFGLSRKAATEFTFFLAIPTLGIASLYELYKERALLSMDDIGMWTVGMLASFVSAFFVVRWLIRFVSTHSFKVFAWYRIAFGLIVLLTWQLGWVHWVEM
ncbi:undecaprenyl-diphosphate phosphatase [Uliginosibacterium sp. 31-16]|uniref:undecaprenyl-diphosphate phosphatase n=1 Tax=Uliginosibacterium sp. 31-16 TaxID=3068315 RepID=UPI00273F0D46|nr:undecaprenyl-diphosphate phosphatase [Uliginosibacterium sp. 31-16]MDP5239270.1 undecaprenyl-diphosphate phosphatase [Uliginosibacterium sp. 31-16]